MTATKAGEWWLGALHAPATTAASGKGVTVAVLSTGVDATHQDLTGSVTTGPDFSASGRKQGSAFWGNEGTAIASLIAGHGHGANGAQGITGVAPGARIASAQVTLEYNDPLATEAAVTAKLPDAIASGIRWAVGKGASVIALPLDPSHLGPAAGNTATGNTGAAKAGADGSTAEKSAVSFALAHNVLLVAPAGDNGARGNATNFPASYPGVVAVGATDRAGQRSPFSATGTYVKLTAPGEGTTPGTAVAGMSTNPAAGLTVAAPSGGYETLASSDMSAALTAGVAALIRSRYPQLTVAEVTQALGHGKLDAATALQQAGTIAAAHPQPGTSASASAAPAAAAPLAASPTAAPSAGSGGLLRSLVTYLAIGAGVLIACLAGALALSWYRRGRYLGPGRHAKGQPLPLAPIQARVAIWPSGHSAAQTAPAQTQPAQSAPLPSRPVPAPVPAIATQPWPGRPGQAAPAQDPFQLTPPAQDSFRPAPPAQDPFRPAPFLPTQTVQASSAQPFGGMPDRTSGPRRPQLAEKPPWELDAPAAAPEPLTEQQEKPPWGPAQPPGSASSAEPIVLPGQILPPDQPDKSLPPWERAPEKFAVAPPMDENPWPITSTGPLYVWNPATSTGPIMVQPD